MLNDAMAKVSNADREHVIGSLLLSVLVSVGELVSTRPWIYDFSRIRQVTAFAGSSSDRRLRFSTRQPAGHYSMRLNPPQSLMLLSCSAIGRVYFRKNSTVVTLGRGDMTADFTCRALSTITKLWTMGGTGAGGCHCIVPVQLELTSYVPRMSAPAGSTPVTSPCNPAPVP